MSTTSVSGASVFTARSSSSPLIPGIMTSVTTTDARSRRRAASATRQPSRSKILESDSRFEVSSSTMSTSGRTDGEDIPARVDREGPPHAERGERSGLLGLRVARGSRRSRRCLGPGLRLAGLGALRGAVLRRGVGLLARGRGGRRLGLRLGGGGGLGSLRGGVPGLELLDAPRGVHELLLARVERVAGGAGLEDVPAVADDLRCLVLGVDGFLHGILSAACTGRAGRAVVRAGNGNRGI